MKKAIIVLVLLMATQLVAQDKSTVTVKSSEVNNGVVIITVLQVATPDQEKGTFSLHCNKGATACKAPDPGSYVMVRLPKNWGMYDCTNVDLYADGADPSTSQKIGE